VSLRDNLPQEQIPWVIFSGRVRRWRGMKKLACRNLFTVVLILFVAPLVLFPGSAQAFVYDDFASKGIDPNLWVDRGPNYGLFSQPGDGHLYYNDIIGGQNDRLRSYNPVSGAFFISMQYSNFQCINNQPVGQGKSSSMQLVLGDVNNSVIMEENKNSYGQGFQGHYWQGGTHTSLKCFYANINSAWLGIRYNGKLGAAGKVDFLFNFGEGWMVLDSCAPNFSQAPWFSIRGYNVYGESLNFQVDQVQIIHPNLSSLNILLLE
jgi:hypothetical protein